MRLSSLFSRIHAYLIYSSRGMGTFLGSVLAILSITYPALWMLAPLSLAAFFHDLWRAPTLKEAFAHALVFGLAASGAGVWWFWDTLPLDWMGVKPSFQWYYVMASWGAVTLVFALAGAATSLLIWRVRKNPFAILLTALSWVLVEEVKMWSFSILTLGERSLLGPHFSSSALGYPLAEHTYLLQIAEWGGLYFLNFAVALMGALLAYAVLLPKSSKRVRQGFVGATFAFLLILAYPLVQTPRTYTGEPLTVGIYTSDYSLDVKGLNTTREYLKAMRSIASSAPEVDLILLPEDNRLEPTFKSKAEKEKALRGIFGKEEPLLVTGDHKLTGRDFSLVLRYEQLDGTLLGEYSKMFLMPAGEYMPYYLTFAFSLLPDKGLSTYQKALMGRAMRGTDVVAAPYKGWTLGGLVCSDFLSPHLYQTLGARDGADLLINLANPAWFHHSPILFDKTLQISKVHAVQSRAYFLQASNGSPSFAITPRGLVFAQSAWHSVGSTVITIPR